MAYFASQRVVDRNRRAAFRKSAPVTGTSEQQLDVGDAWTASSHSILLAPHTAALQPQRVSLL
jgi:hypothetical protein